MRWLSSPVTKQIANAMPRARPSAAVSQGERSRDVNAPRRNGPRRSASGGAGQPACRSASRRERGRAGSAAQVGEPSARLRPQCAGRRSAARRARSATSSAATRAHGNGSLHHRRRGAAAPGPPSCDRARRPYLDQHRAAAVEQPRHAAQQAVRVPPMPMLPSASRTLANRPRRAAARTRRRAARRAPRRRVCRTASAQMSTPSAVRRGARQRGGQPARAAADVECRPRGSGRSMRPVAGRRPAVQSASIGPARTGRAGPGRAGRAAPHVAVDGPPQRRPVRAMQRRVVTRLTLHSGRQVRPDGGGEPVRAGHSAATARASAAMSTSRSTGPLATRSPSPRSAAAVSAPRVRRWTSARPRSTLAWPGRAAPAPTSRRRRPARAPRRRRPSRRRAPASSAGRELRGVHADQQRRPAGPAASANAWASRSPSPLAVLRQTSQPGGAGQSPSTTRTRRAAGVATTVARVSAQRGRGDQRGLLRAYTVGRAGS